MDGCCLSILPYPSFAETTRRKKCIQGYTENIPLRLPLPRSRCQQPHASPVPLLYEPLTLCPAPIHRLRWTHGCRNANPNSATTQRVSATLRATQALFIRDPISCLDATPQHKTNRRGLWRNPRCSTTSLQPPQRVKKMPLRQKEKEMHRCCKPTPSPKPKPKPHPCPMQKPQQIFDCNRMESQHPQTFYV